MNKKVLIGVLVAVIVAAGAAVFFAKPELFQGSAFRKFPFKITKPVLKPKIVLPCVTVPEITDSSTSRSTSIIGGTQIVAIFDITARGPQAIGANSMSVKCTGTGSGNASLNDNNFEVWVDGELKETQSAAADLCDGGTAITLDPLIEIPPGTTKTFTVKYDTTADANQWATGESLVFKIDGKAVDSNKCASNWFYTGPVMIY